MPEDAHASLAGPELPGGQLQQRGLAGPVGTQKPGDAGRNPHGQIIQADDVAVPLGDAVELDDGRHRSRSSDFTRVLKIHSESPNRPASTPADQIHGYCGTSWSARRRLLIGRAALDSPRPKNGLDRGPRRFDGPADLHPSGVGIQQGLAQALQVGGVGAERPPVASAPLRPALARRAPAPAATFQAHGRPTGCRVATGAASGSAARLSCSRLPRAISSCQMAMEDGLLLDAVQHGRQPPS